MNFLNKDTLIEVASIGAGVVSGNFVANKVYGLLPASITDKVAGYDGFIKGAIPVIGGLLLPKFGGNSPIVRGIANGMIASGGAKIVDSILEKAGVNTDGFKSIGNMMGNYYPTAPISGDQTMMSGTDTMMSGMDDGAYDNYAPDSYDTSSASTGEMDY